MERVGAHTDTGVEQLTSGTRVTQTVRTGLQLGAASHAYARLRALRGKVQFTHTWHSASYPDRDFNAFVRATDLDLVVQPGSA